MSVRLTSGNAEESDITAPRSLPMEQLDDRHLAGQVAALIVALRATLDALPQAKELVARTMEMAESNLLHRPMSENMLNGFRWARKELGV
jgi:hypothetical protein